MDFDLLAEIIEAFKQYQLEQPYGKKSSLAEFIAHLKEQGNPLKKNEEEGLLTMIGNNTIEVEISKHIVYLNRYVKLLIKKGLQDFPELINEDFVYLAILMDYESMVKMQLIEQNIHEKPTGLEVIKRLLKHKLIGERDDESDKRSKRVFLTDKGRKIFFKSVVEMQKISKLVTGKLSLKEKNELYHLLKGLADFHNPIFMEHKKKGIDELEVFLK
jgi:DNA-binding MarR family transcriptional regulator